MERRRRSELGYVTSEKYQILGILRVVLCAVNPVRSDLSSRDDFHLREPLPELRDLTFLLFRFFVSEGVVGA